MPSRTFFDQVDAGAIVRPTYYTHANASSSAASLHGGASGGGGGSGGGGEDDDDDDDDDGGGDGGDDSDSAMTSPLQVDYLECTQHPGDVIFLPQDFYHATIASEFAVAIAVCVAPPVVC